MERRKFFDKLIGSALNKGFFYSEALEYGEQGYSKENPEGFILMHDWNELYDTHPNLMEYLEMFHNIEWSDEWVTDWENGGKCYRVSGDSWGWEMQVRFTDDGRMLTPDSDENDWLEYLTQDLENSSENRVMPSFLDIDLEEQGFELYDTLSHGFYGRTVNMDDLKADILESGKRFVLFKLSDTGQFEIEFKVYVK